MADPGPPGTYVEEIRGPFPPPIAGAPMGITGFVGVTETGPVEPTLVTSWVEFTRTFGGFIDRAPFVTPYWRLPYAVRGFFENGGARAYVARVLDPMAPASPGDLDAVMGGAGNAAAPTGIDGLMALGDVSLVAVPDGVVAPAFTEALLDRCIAARTRLAVVDVASVGAHPLTGAPARDTSFGACYYPRLLVPAPHLPAGHAVVPASGHVAGRLAATPVGAPAGRHDTEIAAASLVPPGHPGGALDVVVPAAEADRLRLRGVNVLRDFRALGQGVRIWGVRTMSTDPEWKYVPLRRLLLFLERSIDRGTQWVVFEPNVDRTWAGVRAAIEDFLAGQWRGGAFMGRKPEEAFFVRCDRTTMTQNDLDNGRLIALVGVAPLRAAEFVIFRIGQWTADRPRP